MSSKLARGILCTAVVCLLAPPPVHTQGIGGSIVGTVRDQSGGVVPAVLVQITNSDTNQKRSVSSDGQGRFQARELPPGTYTVRAELSGFNTVEIKGFRIGVGQNARQDITLQVAEVGAEIRVEAESDVALTESTTPTLSTSFSDKQIRELPILSRDLNNLGLLAPGVFSARSFSFASTLVPFAANGSRGRDNNFIIDSVDNNEPLFGGAATQFTNTDIFAEYRILTNQYKAEYGRNSGSVVNIVTERGGNRLRGSAFWFGQHDAFNATTEAERQARLRGPTRFYENVGGATVGGPIKREKTWFFASYQWDRARHDLTPIYPIISTGPTTAGLASIAGFNTPTVAALLGVPTVTDVPGTTSPCGGPTSGLPADNPCTLGTVFASVIPAPFAPVEFGTFLVPRAGVFDVRDHQASIRIDHRLTDRDDIYFRYLFDDLATPRTVGANAISEVAFFDQGLFPEWRAIFKQRTQSMGGFWTRAWATALQEVRVSWTRIASQTGAFGISESDRETLPSAIVLDNFASGINLAGGGTFQGTSNFLAAFPAAGSRFTVGRDTRPSMITSNIFSGQYNLSISRGVHSIKLGANFVRTQSDIRSTPADLGQYVYRDFDDFVNNIPFFGYRRLPNFGGTGGQELPLREFGQAYFLQDDWRVHGKLILSLGLRYEYFGQAINKVGTLNTGFGSEVEPDRNNFAPRIGFAWSPDGKTTIRGGYGFYFNPTVFNIALLTWQSGPISPFISGCNLNHPAFFLSGFCLVNPSFTNVFPELPFNAADITAPGVVPFIQAFSPQDTISRNLVQPYLQNYSLTVQRQMWKDTLLEISYVGSKGTKLFQRADLNPQQGWIIDPLTAGGVTCVVVATCVSANVLFTSRLDPFRESISSVTNGGRSIYHALQVTGTQRLSRMRNWGGLAMTTAYTWSHMIDNASEIFGPGVSLVNPLAGTAGQTIEAVTPFAQDPNDTVRGERGNSSFDRRHRLAISYLWTLPNPSGQTVKWVLGNWQLNGFITGQSGQPFSPINSGLNSFCVDANGDGVLINDRPLAGNPNAPAGSVALLNNTLCLDPFSTDPRIRAVANNPLNAIVAGAGAYITPDLQSTDPSLARFIQAANNQTGNVGRNILRGPNVFNVDLAAFKHFLWGDRYNLQFRVEVFNVMNRRNPGQPSGNVFTTDAQPIPATAFGTVSPSVTPARAVGVIPENFIDATDSVTGDALFLSQRFMNTSSRKFQFAIKFLW